MASSDASPAGLAGSREPLSREHDLAMLDLDGVVYVGGRAVVGAPEAIRAARAEGLRVAFVTNNAARTATTVAEHLRGLGVDADAGDVVTSAQAAARLARDRHGPGAGALVLGAEGLRSAVLDAGLTVIDPDEASADDAQLLITGYGPEVRWRQIMSAAVRVRGGLPWIASNTDRSIPTPEGLAPGHGVLVELIARFAEVEPLVAGKPARPLLDVTLQRVGAERALMVGDRIDTDIEGGRNAHVATLLVMTGVSGLAELAACSPSSRPTHLGAGLEALSETHPAVRADDDGSARVEGWTARVVDGALEVRGQGGVGGWWRACAVALWHHLDEHGRPADVAASTPPTT